ncbi:MAG: phosphoribosylformylglycinamidine synthase subunit PurL [bacterium]|nr:phosphoribosylformylglycinamidine synthase subunit PurL [bacterium]
MAARITVTSKIQDARASGYLKTLKALFPALRLESVAVTLSYTIDAQLSQKECELVAERLTNPLTEEYSITLVQAPASYAYAIEIGYLPGVTDNVGNTARQTAEDCLRRKFKDGEAVYSSVFIYLAGEITQQEAEAAAGELHNSLIERATIYPASSEFKIIVPRVALQRYAPAGDVDLNVSDAELEKIGKEGIKDLSTMLGASGTPRGPLALSLRAMKVIQEHFAKLGRNPTDVELEALAQTWSEHCKHTIFADPLDEVKEGIYRRYIKGATQKIRKQKGKKDFCVSVFTDNSGAIAFDDEYLVTHKVETHNSPSALDPFGGSVTAIVGVNRDCLGFGKGAKPIANVYGFCVADPNDATALYRDAAKKQQLLPARRILEGVVRGINAGGNQSGIPTPLGFVAVDPSYRGKPLVYGGTVGLIPRKLHGKKLYEKGAQAGDYIVMVGGRVGADGIHGATFSSESLSGGSPATAVQIGDPITQKKLSDVIIREARGRGLYSSITDNGAGGLSGAVGEMARESGGCEVDLAKVPLKYPGLAPWQIWLSESQERMTLAVPEKSWPALKKIFDRHDVEATRIGEFTKSGRCVVKFGRKNVMDIALSFLHDGRPIEIQKSKKPKGRTLGISEGPTLRNPELGEALLQILARPNVCSTSFIAEQYDHEVQGSSVTKPLEGKGRVNADAGVLQPLSNSSRGVVLAHGYCPWYSAIDTYKMAAASIDTAIRNAVCAGASRDYLAILDNFCWSSSEKPERLHELKEAARACFDTATDYGTPFISGKDSMFNDFRGFTEDGKNIHIAALPTLLISAIGVIPDVAKAMTIDFKQAGDSIYLVGETNDELGASEYFAMLGEKTGSIVPTVDAKKNAKVYDAISKVIQNNLVASAISVGRGGLATALAKSSIAGRLGAEVSVSKIPGNAKKDDAILFSESQGRMLVSVRPESKDAFEKIFRGLAVTEIGTVGVETVSIALPDANIKTSLVGLTNAYRSFFKNW